MSKTYEACMKCGDVFFPAVSRHPLCCDCAVAEIARLEAKNAELKTAIASHNTRMDAVPSINRPISAVVGLRFLAEWFDKVYDDAKYGDDKVQQDCRKWATEIEATERELAEKQAVVEKQRAGFIRNLLAHRERVVGSFDVGTVHEIMHHYDAAAEAARQKGTKEHD